MRLEIRIFDDQDQVVAEYKGDPSQPGAWRATPGQRLVSNMPQQSDNKNTGTYELAGFTYQPHVRVERPNGYTAPIPGPNNGLSAGFPSSLFPPRGSNVPVQAIKMNQWGPLSPTAAPAPSASNSTPTHL